MYIFVWEPWWRKGSMLIGFTLPATFLLNSNGALTTTSSFLNISVFRSVVPDRFGNLSPFFFLEGGLLTLKCRPFQNILFQFYFISVLWQWIGLSLIVSKMSRVQCIDTNNSDYIPFTTIKLIITTRKPCFV